MVAKSAEGGDEQRLVMGYIENRGIATNLSETGENLKLR
jgi:hypothetical protein